MTRCHAIDSLLYVHVHFNDNTNCFPSTDIRQDKLFKIRPFIDAIQHNFKLIEPERLSEIIPKNKNFKLSFDNWFTSYNLVVNSKNHGILGVGTVRSNRLSGCQFENNKNLKKLGRESYDTKINTTNAIVACKWFDNKTVHLVSNYIGPEPLNQVQRWSIADKLPIERPATVKEYNSFMGAIDLHDMLVEIYQTDIKCKRYYIRIIFHIIDMCIVNSCV